MTKKMRTWIVVGLLALAGLIPLVVRASPAAPTSAAGSLALVSIVGLTVTVDQEILCSPCEGTLHWGDAAGSMTAVFGDDNPVDQFFSYAQAGCYEPILVVHNTETSENASYSAGKLPVGPGAVCASDQNRRAFFPQVLHQEPPPTPAPTVTPTPTATPDACPGDPIADPSFEQRCGWEFSGKLGPWYTRQVHKDGSRALGLGVPPGEDDDLAAYSQASQWITIPAWASILRGYYYAESEETASSALPPERGLAARFGLGASQAGLLTPAGIDRAVDTDTAFVYLSRSYDDDIRRVLWKPNYNQPTWQSFEVEISFLRGQTILLMIGLGTDGDGLSSRVYFDYFSVR